MNDRLESLLIGPMVMVASLHAATEVWRNRADRRRGHDASLSEPDDQARHHILESAEILAEIAFRSAATDVALSESTTDAAGGVVLRFDAMLATNRAAGLLEDCHRRLLTLYPAISSTLVEEARLLAADCRDAVESGLDLPVEQLHAFLGGLRAELLSP